MDFYQQPNMMYQGMQQNPQAATRFENALTADEIEQLQKKVSQFSIAITNEERLRAICNHRDKTGTKDACIEDPITGNMRCTICGYEFKPIDPNTHIEDIKESVQVIENILQTIKLLYIDLPPEAARDYFQIIALIDKIPSLFEFAGKNFSKHEVNQWNLYGRQPGVINMFNNLMNAFGGGQMMQPGMMNPQMMNQPAGMPTYGNMNMGGFGYPGTAPSMNQQMQQPMSNGFGFVGQPQQPMEYQPQTGGFQYVPQQPTAGTPTVNPNPAAQPQAPVAPQTTEVAPATDTVKTSVKA